MNKYNKPIKSMNIIISGASGFIGSAITQQLLSEGSTVKRLVRNESGTDESSVYWNPVSGVIDKAKFEGSDAVIHLAGENIAGGRWNKDKKRRIYESRVEGTKMLSDALAELSNPPRVLLSSSAVGIYGDRGDEILSEESPAGDGFLAEVCRDWEAAAESARQAGIRVVNLRFGMVLDRKGGALAKMLTPFRLGLGGILGSGVQYMSWIMLEDIPGIISFILTEESLSGPVNAVSSCPVTNREFTKTLGRVLGRPAVCPVPAFAARLAFGEMADALLLASARVMPSRLQDSGYTFQHNDLETALKSLFN